MGINRKEFYNRFRVVFSPRLRQAQVDGFEAMFDWWGQNNPDGLLAQLAYCLASAWHETGGRMEPVREGFCETNEGSIRAVTSLYNRGIISRNYALPNAQGLSYYGRGLIQITHEDNYLRLGQAIGLGNELRNNPDKALELDTAVKILFVGMTEGLFTGKRLDRYINASQRDFVNARRVVNGLDRAEKIAGYALDFVDCLNKRD